MIIFITMAARMAFQEYRLLALSISHSPFRAGIDFIPRRPATGDFDARQPFHDDGTRRAIPRHAFAIAAALREDFPPRGFRPHATRRASLFYLSSSITTTTAIKKAPPGDTLTFLHSHCPLLAYRHSRPYLASALIIFATHDIHRCYDLLCFAVWRSLLACKGHLRQEAAIAPWFDAHSELHSIHRHFEAPLFDGPGL